MEKHLALAQHLGLEVFEFEGNYYVGANQDEFEDLNQKSDWSFDEAYVESNYLRLDAEIEQSSHDDSRFEYGSEEYLVCTDEEADSEWDTYMDNFIDDCVLCELPENYRRYFDSEKFKKDCSYDGRGTNLAGYDGNENEETVNDTNYYIYRTN